MTADEQTPGKPNAIPQDAGEQPGGAPCILVADDVALMRSLLTHALTKERSSWSTLPSNCPRRSVLPAPKGTFPSRR